MSHWQKPAILLANA